MTSNRRSLAQALMFGALYGRPASLPKFYTSEEAAQKFYSFAKQLRDDPEASARAPMVVLDSYSEGNSEGVPVQVRTSHEYEFPPTKSMLYYHVQSALMQWFPPEVQ